MIVLLLLLLLLLAISGEILRTIIGFIIMGLIIVWIIKNFKDIVEFIIALIPLFISGGIVALILYILISIAY